MSLYPVRSGIPRSMKQKIVDFEQDELGDWIARLACGHQQHVRHRPPWINRPWVATPAGRDAHRGAELECGKCDDARATIHK
jgi:hypothetical protein